MENEDLAIMSAEADIYQAITFLAEKFNSISDNIHLLDFKSNDEACVNFRSSLHGLLKSSIPVQETLIGLLEKLYDYHEVEYTK